MPPEPPLDLEQLVLGSLPRIDTDHDVVIYTNNPAMIKGLHQQRVRLLAMYARLHSTNVKHEEDLDKLTEERNRLEHSLTITNRLAVYVFALGLSASLTSGLGANFATTSPRNPVGWILLGFSVLNSIIAFMLNHVIGRR